MRWMKTSDYFRLTIRSKRRTCCPPQPNHSICLQEVAEDAEGFQPISLRSLRTPVKCLGELGFIAGFNNHSAIFALSALSLSPFVRSRAEGAG
jgi:hypothetical protein